jgi:hypothetical protein
MKRTGHEQKTYSCDVCSKNFQNNHSLRDHIEKTSHEQTSYAFGVCGSVNETPALKPTVPYQSHAKDVSGKTALLYAISSDYKEIVKLLLGYNADINAKDIYLWLDGIDVRC